MDDKRDFKVNLGDPVQLQYIPENGRERLNARVIGHAPNKSLIVTVPRTSGQLPLLNENQAFVVRMLQGNNVYGFESSILKYYSIPYPHIHLRHPKDVECITVRSSRRVETEMIVSVKTEHNPDKILSISMLNTSATGALLQTKDTLGALNDKLEISIELVIVNIKKYLRINAVVRNISTPEDRDNADDRLNKYGVEFLDLQDEQILIINAYVYEHIVLHMDEH